MTLRSSSGSQHRCYLQFRRKRRRRGVEEGVCQSEGGEGKGKRGEMREEEDGWNKQQERSDDGLKERSNENLPQVPFLKGTARIKGSRFIYVTKIVVN